MPGPLTEEKLHCGLPALFVRPRTDLAYNLTRSASQSDDVAEGQYLARCIAEFARKQNVDVIHILQWAMLKTCLFEAALLAGIPFVHTPYEYWSVCPQYFLMQHGAPSAVGRMTMAASAGIA